MTAAEWAKWSVVTLMAIGILAGRIVTNSARRAAGKNIDAAGAIGVVIGILLQRVDARCRTHLVATMTDDDYTTIWMVVHKVYTPLYRLYSDSFWASKEEAQRRADQLGPSWEVAEWHVCNGSVEIDR